MQPLAKKIIIGVLFVVVIGYLLLQLPFRVRATDVDDLLLNTLGVMLGYGIYALVRALKKRRA